MKKFTLLVGFAALVIGLGGCSDDDGDTDAVDTSATSAPADTDTTTVAQQADDVAYVAGTYVQNASDFVDAADWDNAEEITVELDSFSFAPADLTFEAGKPYIIELVNISDEKHYFTAADFFASAAWRKIESPQSEIKAPFFTAVEVLAGQKVELYLIPTATMDGSELLCTIEGHADSGMLGTITVTGPAPTSPAPVFANIAGGPWNQAGPDIVDAADWDSAEEVTVELDSFSFAPADLTFETGQPYIVDLVNVSDEKHYFVAEDLFPQLALRKAQDESAEYKAPTLKAVEVLPGMTTELYLIPTEEGTFNLICTIEGHEDEGMTGAITVETTS